MLHLCSNDTKDEYHLLLSCPFSRSLVDFYFGPPDFCNIFVFSCVIFSPSSTAVQGQTTFPVTSDCSPHPGKIRHNKHLFFYLNYLPTY